VDEGDTLSDEDDSEGDLEPDMPDATWDEADQVYRCNECCYEVLEGACQSLSCSLRHNWSEVCSYPMLD
jgi:hypothetical protein